MGIICRVTARPTSILFGCRTCQPASHWLRYPRAFNPRTSSADMSFSFSSRSSGTFGRPSGNRSNGFCAVYLIICSLLRLKICPQRAWRNDHGEQIGSVSRLCCIQRHKYLLLFAPRAGSHAVNHVLPGRTIFFSASSLMVRPMPGRSGT